jgi:hypothetical protein
MTQPSIINAPTNMPGKSPAKKTVAGNLLQCAWIEAAAALEVFVAVAVELADVVFEVEVELLEAGDVSVDPDLLELVKREQKDLSLPCPATQAYPKGQQLSPHRGNESPKRVVKMLPSAFAVTFCRWISHITAAILEQFWPSGQHREEELLSREMQFEPAPHLKLSGSLLSTVEHDSESARRDIDLVGIVTG